MPIFVYNLIPGQEEGYKTILQEKGVGKYLAGKPETKVGLMKKMIYSSPAFNNKNINSWQEYLLLAPEKLKEVVEKIANVH
jgi:hypothetical protein